MKSNLDIVKTCDNFPYSQLGSRESYLRQFESLWQFFLPEDPNPCGYLLTSTVERMPWTDDFRLVSTPQKEVHLIRSVGEDWQHRCTQAIDKLLDLARAREIFQKLGRKRDERWPILGAKFNVGIERSASSLFGIIGRGAHMTVYTRTMSGFKFWVPQRNAKKSTYPGMLDNTVAGGLAADETPFECLIREAVEEAAMPEDLVRREAHPAGVVTWLNISDHKAGGEVGLINPGVLYVYDLEVGGDLVLKPVDNDIQVFHLMDVNQVKAAIAQERFKPSCAAVMIDFFIRHGFITPEDEPDYIEIVARLHRKLPFLTRPPQ